MKTHFKTDKSFNFLEYIRILESQFPEANNLKSERNRIEPIPVGGINIYKYMRVYDRVKLCSQK